MSALVRDLHVEQGASLVQRYTWTTMDGTRQSFAGWRPVAQIRQYPGTRLLLDLSPHLSIVEGVTDSRGVTGQAIEINVPADATRAVDAPARWDLRIVDATGGEHARAVVLVRGDVTYTEAVTDA